MMKNSYQDSVNTREIAVNALYEILEQGAYSHICMNDVLSKYQYLDKSMRAYINRAVIGTVEKKLTLDYIINNYSKTKVKKLKPWIRTCFRLAVYEIVYMDYVPDHAAVDEAVSTVKKHGLKSLSGFCNGVLRSIVRGKEAGDIAKLLDDACDEAKYSIPQWIIDLWTLQYGSETAGMICDGFMETPDLSVRVDMSDCGWQEVMEELAEDGVEVRRDVELDDIVYLKGVNYLSGLTAFKEGHIYPQDPSSARVAHELEYKSVMRVLDVCAAPGGKACHVGAIMSAKGCSGEVIACDVSDKKVNLINENIKRLEASNVVAKKQDAIMLNEDYINSFDAVVADVPCSGLGVIRKKPDIRYRITPEDLASIAELQKKIINNVCQYVKVGGELIYSTCTINKDENENQVEEFINMHPEFEVVSEQIITDVQENDGFYICKMMKN